jgi:hypothetical protein
MTTHHQTGVECTDARVDFNVGGQRALGGDNHLVVARRAAVHRSVAKRGRDRGDVVVDGGVFVDVERDDAAGGERRGPMVDLR